MAKQIEFNVVSIMEVPMEFSGDVDCNYTVITTELENYSKDKQMNIWGQWIQRLDQVYDSLDIDQWNYSFLIIYILFVPFNSWEFKKHSGWLWSNSIWILILTQLFVVEAFNRESFQSLFSFNSCWKPAWYLWVYRLLHRGPISLVQNANHSHQ